MQPMILAAMEPRILDLDFQLLADAVLSLIAVFFLFFMASNLLFNPVRKMLEKRREKIQSELEEAETDKEAAASLKAEYEARLKGIDAEGEEILAAARKQAIVNENKIINDAREEAARIISRAQVEAELEKEKARDTIKTEIIEVAALLAAKAISEKMSVSIEEQLIEDTLKEMGNATWQS